MLFRSRNYPSCKVTNFLNFGKLTFGSTSPYAEAISNVREDIGLNKNFEHIIREKVAKPEQGY